jgi:methionyl-tRNA synthetase
MERSALDLALTVTWNVVRWCNKYIDDIKPWKLVKENPEKIPGVMYNLLERQRHIAWMLKPFMPETADKMFMQLGIADQEAKKTFKQAKEWGGIPDGISIAKGEPLFPRLEAQ